MNYYEHHLGDWAKKCAHLRAIEEGVYLRLLHWYYSNERPLPHTSREVCRLARVTSPNERAAVSRVLSEFFELMSDGWHNHRADREIAKYEKGVPATHERKRNTADRQARSRARRRSMFEALRAVEVVPHFNVTNYELIDLCREHGIAVPQFGEVTEGVTRRVTVTSQDLSTAAQQPYTIEVPRDMSRVTSHVAVTSERLGTAARAIKKAGFAAVNSGDPRLSALIEAGCTDEELRIAAAEATAKGKGWAWLLATVKGRREDAARVVASDAAMPQQTPQTARQRADAATVAAWVPQLAAKP